MNFAHDTLEIQNLCELSNNELIEQYKELSSVYLKQRNAIDGYKQRIYKLEQDIHLKDNILEDELQSMSETHERELEDIRRKLIGENKDLNCKIAEQNVTLELLVQENENLKSELRIIVKQPTTVKTTLNNCDRDEIFLSKDRIEYLNKLETDHMILLDEIANLKSANSMITSQLVNAEVSNEQSKRIFKLNYIETNFVYTIPQKQLEELQEYYDCSKENLKCKIDELEDAKNIIDSMQEKLIDIENELVIYKDGDVEHSK